MKFSNFNGVAHEWQSLCFSYRVAIDVVVFVARNNQLTIILIEYYIRCAEKNNDRRGN